jgi:hypothetical protein
MAEIAAMPLSRKRRGSPGGMTTGEIGGEDRGPQELKPHFFRLRDLGPKGPTP